MKTHEKTVGGVRSQKQKKDWIETQVSEVKTDQHGFRVRNLRIKVYICV